MSLQPHSGAEIPPLTARVARAANPKGTTAMWIHDRLDGRPRPPTAFQQYLDARDLPRPLWWRQGK
ncbi:hypothetical protein [Streptomyces sp. NPDC059455]|uniref:hypothetical protein n=1 Tax=Streptomyces sp. NPDC059455 TaxID=3346837 RepID=UPI0036A2EA9E